MTDHNFIELRHGQQGMALLEALISVLIFSVGCLALIGLQAMSLKSNTDSKFRSDAAYLANQLISQMWVETPAELIKYNHHGTGTPGTNGSCSFEGDATTNTKALSWLNEVTAQLGPSAASNMQQITVAAQKDSSGLIVIGYQVSVTLCWRQPSDAADKYHNFTASAQIGTNT